MYFFSPQFFSPLIVITNNIFKYPGALVFREQRRIWLRLLLSASFLRRANNRLQAILLFKELWWFILIRQIFLNTFTSPRVSHVSFRICPIMRWKMSVTFLFCALSSLLHFYQFVTEVIYSHNRNFNLNFCVSIFTYGRTRCWQLVTQ